MQVKNEAKTLKGFKNVMVCRKAKSAFKGKENKIKTLHSLRVYNM